MQNLLGFGAKLAQILRKTYSDFAQNFLRLILLQKKKDTYKKHKFSSIVGLVDADCIVGLVTMEHIVGPVAREHIVSVIVKELNKRLIAKKRIVVLVMVQKKNDTSSYMHNL